MMIKLLKNPVLLVLSCIFIFCLATAISQVPYKDLNFLFLKEHQFNFLLVVGIFSLNLFLVAFRQFLIYKQFHCLLPYHQVLRASLSGQVCGLFFLPLLSNILGQGFQLKKTAIPPGLTAVTSIYERFLMAGIGILLALMSLIYLNPSFLNNLSSLSIPAIHLFIPFFLIGTIVFIRVFFAKKSLLTPIFSLRNILYFTYTILCTLTSWGLMSLAFSILILSVNPEASVSMALSASLIVSFLASLPISPNGWGIRELAAVKLFPLVGLTTADALGVSVSIGLIALATVLLVGSATLVIIQKFQSKELSLASSSMPNRSLVNLENKAIIFLTIATAVSIFFQIKLEVQQFLINVNLADIFALTGLAIVILNYFLLKQKPTIDLPFFKHFLYASPVVFLLAFLVGWYKFGFIPWAFYSKFLGWFVIIGYVALGSLFSKIQGEQGLKRLISLMSLTLFVIVAYHFFLFFSFRYQLLPSEFLSGDYSAALGLQGYALNRNSFSFQLLTMIVLLHITLNFHEKAKPQNTIYWMLAIFYCGIFFTFSRAGLITLLILFTGLLLTKSIKLDQLKRLLFPVTLCMTFFLSFGYILDLLQYLIQSFQTLMESSTHFSHRPHHPVTLYSTAESNHERFYTMFEGLKMWLKSPFWGEGLGSFMTQELAINQRPLIIHNTFIWLLAEFGLIGSSIFIIFGLSIFRYLYQKISRYLTEKPTFNDGILLGIVIVFVMMSLVHEVLYQRIFWLTLGLIAIQHPTKPLQNT